MGTRKIKIEYALRDICSRYTNISKKDIELFSPVFYPIARIQADMQEKTFEDFEAVQEAVLRFVNLGFRKEADISDLMGLSEEYVRNMLKLLTTFGHIDRNRNVTELGRASLDEGKKITLAHTRQVFLIDAINCNIIRIDRDLDRAVIESVNELSEWEKNIQFLDHEAGISKAEIENTLKNSQYNTLKRIKGGLNINVSDVSNIECLGIKYIKSYILKLKNHPPVIFIKRYDFNGEGTDRFYWLPFSVENEDEMRFFNLGKGTVDVHSGNAKEIINDAYKRTLERRDSDYMEEKLQGRVAHYREHYKIELQDKGMEVCVSSKDIFEYSNKILFVLWEFHKDGCYLIVDDSMSGRFFYLYPDKNDSKLTECSELVSKAMEKYSFEKIVSHIEGNFEKNENPVDELLRVLRIPVSN